MRKTLPISLKPHWGTSALKLISFITVILFFSTNSLIAQELPSPDSLYVSTQCSIREGNSFQDVVEEGRQGSTSGPNRVFFRQPIAGSNVAENQFTRIVVWDNMEHWASNVVIASSDTYNCDNNNRRFWTNRNLGSNRNAYNGTDVSLVTTRRCTIQKGYNISDVYTSLNNTQLESEANGRTSVMHVSHLLLGPSSDSEMRTTIIKRTIGESEIGLARDLDSSFQTNLGIGTPANVPAEFCTDAGLSRSYIIYSASR